MVFPLVRLGSGSNVSLDVLRLSDIVLHCRGIEFLLVGLELTFFNFPVIRA